MLLMPTISNAALAVKNALEEKGLENPVILTSLNMMERRNKIASHFQQILELMGLDLSDDSLANTPERVAKMYLDEIFSGLQYENFPKMTLIKNTMHFDEMIRVKDIHLTSTCEHHLITIDGYATVAYIPKNWVIGLSKINRIVDFFAQRPQVQERLCQQILVALQTILETKDVAVAINATHYCIKARGIKDRTSKTLTTVLEGAFKTNTILRQDFAHLVP